MQCPDCVPLDRRQFLKTTAMAGAAAVTGTAANLSGKSSETLVGHLYESLSAEQKQKVAFDFKHPLRSKIDNNWHITPVRIGQFFNREQQAMITSIFKGLHNPEFVDQVMQHLVEDSGGIGNYSVALFGTPGSGNFEFVLTGRHCTVRCDGDSVDGAAFGGPMFYGHESGGSFNEAADHPGNVYWYQAKRANEVFAALDGRQQKLALRSDPKKERGTATVELSGKREGLPGIPMTEMSRDQRDLVRKVMADLLAPFRKADADETMKLVKAGGFNNLHMAFYKNLDVGDDGVWDVWQLEGPSMLWFFRGHPHVHTWVHVRQPRRRKVI